MNELISVVTVCKNAEKNIINTIKSVINQEYENIEYIILDGASNDNTLTLIQKYIDSVDTQKKVIVQSEEDTGIYNAMNKAISKANGKWIVFMNAGDEFASSNVCTDMLKESEKDVDFIYGNVICYNENLEYISMSKNIETIKKRIPFCHQSVFNKTETIKKYMYNEQYKICADYEMYYRAYMDGCVYKKTDIIVAKYLLDGFSKKNQNQNIEEIAKIKYAFGDIKFMKLYICLVKIRVTIFSIIKKIIPRSLLYHH